MTRTHSLLLTACAMLAFAGNSLLCRLALRHTGIDAASFTSVRLVAGALMLWLLLQLRRSGQAGDSDASAGSGESGRGNWLSAAALCLYAAGFSWAYMRLSAATGALLLFGAVQATMVGHGLWAGERLRPLQCAGLLTTLAGLLALLLPGMAAPPLSSAMLMLGAGVAWGVYSLRGKGTGDPLAVSAGNFLRAVPLALALAAASYPSLSLDTAGLLYAVASGALASGIGYAIWYTALPTLSSTTAASVQLSVPVLAALGGIAFLGESASLRLVLASVAILGGIGLVIWQKQRVPAG
jgi:drug/metabolite transporter (DMT)-like permease